MNCNKPDCAERGATKDDAFCETHWRALPHWARVELVKLRNESRRGNQDRVREYLMACAVASKLTAPTGP